MLRSILSFEGRADRETYWTVGALILLAKLCALFIAGGLLAGLETASADPSAYQWRMWAAGVLFDAVAVWPLAALQFRRAHDRSASGLASCAFLIVATLWGALPSPLVREWLPELVRHGLSAIVWAVAVPALIISQGVLPGTPGDNRFGAPRPRPRFA